MAIIVKPTLVENGSGFSASRGDARRFAHPVLNGIPNARSKLQRHVQGCGIPVTQKSPPPWESPAVKPVETQVEGIGADGSGQPRLRCVKPRVISDRLRSADRRQYGRESPVRSPGNRYFFRSLGQRRRWFHPGQFRRIAHQKKQAQWPGIISKPFERPEYQIDLRMFRHRQPGDREK